MHTAGQLPKNIIGIVVGIGFGCLFTPSVSILPLYFRKQRALANGLAASGASFGKWAHV